MLLVEIEDLSSAMVTLVDCISRCQEKVSMTKIYGAVMSSSGLCLFESQGICELQSSSSL